jgi:protein Mpv17
MGVSAQTQSNSWSKLNMVASIKPEFAEEVPPSEQEWTSSTVESLQEAVTNNLQQHKFINLNHVVDTGIVVTIAALVFWKLTMEGDMSHGVSAQEMITRIPLAAWDSYSSVLDRAPIMTKAATSATVYTIGDIIAQSSAGAELIDIDRMRTLRSMLAGLIGHGPLSHFWYHFSDNLFDNILHWTAWWSFIPKVALDQSTWVPVWNNSYILLLGLMKRESLESMWSNMKRTTIPLIVSGLKLWPLAHCITYGLIPTEDRLLFDDMLEIVWVVILATTAADAMKDHDAIAAPESTNVDGNASVDLKQ